MKRWRWAAVNEEGRVIGQDHATAKLSDADIDLIHELAAAGLSARQIARKFDGVPRVSKSHVAYVLRGQRRGHVVVGQKRVTINPRLTPAAPDEFE